MLISDIAIGIAVAAFCATQIHLFRVARKLIRNSKASWNRAMDEISGSESRLTNMLTESIAGIQKDVTESIRSLPSSFSDVARNDLAAVSKEHTQFLVNEFEKAVQCVQTQIAGVEEKMLGKMSMRLGGDPTAAQAASVEARRMNQVVDTLELAVQGPSITAKVNELAQFLTEVGQPELGDWITEHPDTIPKIERRIMSNPQLAQRLNALRGRVGGRTGTGGGSVVSNYSGIVR